MWAIASDALSLDPPPSGLSEEKLWREHRIYIFPDTDNRWRICQMVDKKVKVLGHEDLRQHALTAARSKAREQEGGA